MRRELFEWLVDLQSQTGEVVQRRIAAYWSPEQPETADAIGRTAAVQEWWASKKTVLYAPVKVERVVA